MSSSPESELDLELHFLPAWARESPDTNRFANFKGGPEERGRRRGDRGDPRDRGAERRDRPPRRDAGGRPAGRGGPPRGEPRDRGRGSGPRPERREAPPPPPPLEIKVALLPEEKGVESLAKQIKLTGRAYPLFDIAALVVKRPERYHVTFNVIKKPDGTVAQPLFVCALDDTLWPSEAEAVAHVLARHFDTFYQTEKTKGEAPKGTYTFVAQCGLSGVILGPPNYHDYQNKLRKLHAERFARMPFDAYKARVKIVKDEAVVKQWIEDQSWKVEYTCLNVPEPLTLPTREAVEQHFRATHLPNVIRPVESHTLPGPAAHQLRSAPLRTLVRCVVDDQLHFPMDVANELSRRFAQHGLQFFKVNRKFTHVAVARPHFLDLDTTPVSEGVRRIVEFINANPGCTRRKLLDALAPGASPPAPAPAEGAAPAEPPEPTPEQTAVISDLHWLIHQGHVLEFANGRLETAKRPLPKTPNTAEAKPATVPPKAGAGPADEAAAESIPDSAEATPPSNEAPSAESAEPTPLEATAPAAGPTDDVPEGDTPRESTVARNEAAAVSDPAMSVSSPIEAAAEEAPAPERPAG